MTRKACQPRGRSVASTTMRAPSLALWWPSRRRQVTCRSTSAEPSSGTMKPKPLATSNHLIRPATSDEVERSLRLGALALDGAGVVLLARRTLPEGA